MTTAIPKRDLTERDFAELAHDLADLAEKAAKNGHDALARELAADAHDCANTAFALRMTGGTMQATIH